MKALVEAAAYPLADVSDIVQAYTQLMKLRNRVAHRVGSIEIEVTDDGVFGAPSLVLPARGDAETAEVFDVARFEKVAENCAWVREHIRAVTIKLELTEGFKLPSAPGRPARAVSWQAMAPGHTPPGGW